MIEACEEIFMFNFEEELKKLPRKPGVYIMRADKDVILYVGKAIRDNAGEEKKTINTEEIMEIFNRISVECGN